MYRKVEKEVGDRGVTIQIGHFKTHVNFNMQLLKMNVDQRHQRIRIITGNVLHKTFKDAWNRCPDHSSRNRAILGMRRNMAMQIAQESVYLMCDRDSLWRRK